MKYGQPEFRIIYVTKPTRIENIQQKQGSDFLLILFFNFISSVFARITWRGRPEDKVGISMQKRGPNILISFYKEFLQILKNWTI